MHISCLFLLLLAPPSCSRSLRFSFQRPFELLFAVSSRFFAVSRMHTRRCVPWCVTSIYQLPFECNIKMYGREDKRLRARAWDLLLQTLRLLLVLLRLNCQIIAEEKNWIIKLWKHILWSKIEITLKEYVQCHALFRSWATKENGEEKTPERCSDYLF